MEFLFNPAVSREEWNEFVIRHGGGFLQSFEWGGFQPIIGNAVARVMVKKDCVPVLCVDIIVHTLLFKKSFWYVPYGPVISEAIHNKKEITRFFIERFTRIAGKEAIFLKIEPEKISAQE